MTGPGDNPRRVAIPGELPDDADFEPCGYTGLNCEPDPDYQREIEWYDEQQPAQ